MKSTIGYLALGAALLLIVVAAIYLPVQEPARKPPKAVTEAEPEQELNTVVPASRPRMKPADFSRVEESGPTPSTKSLDTYKHSLAYRIRAEPALIYNTYIREAERGDARAQFIVAQALRACPSGKLTEAEAQELKYDHNFPQEFKDAVAELWERCSALYDQLPGTDNREAYLSWLETAIENGSAIAQLERDLIYNSGVLAEEHYLTLLPRAFEEAGDDEYFRLQAFYSVIQYFSQYRDWQEEQRAAWYILSCRAEPGCEENELMAEYYPDYHPHEIESIKAKAQSYLEALEEKDYYSLELDLIVEAR